MKKNALKIVAALVGLTGAYLVYKYIKGSKKESPIGEQSQGDIGKGGAPITNVTKTGGGVNLPPIVPPILSSPSKTAGGNYVVKTVSATGKLNVRTLPNTSTSKVLYQLNNGDVIKAQKSSVASGWHEVLDVSKSFPVVVGYVSSSFLVPKI